MDLSAVYICHDSLLSGPVFLDQYLNFVATTEEAERFYVTRTDELPVISTMECKFGRLSVEDSAASLSIRHDADHLRMVMLSSTTEGVYYLITKFNDMEVALTYAPSTTGPKLALCRFVETQAQQFSFVPYEVVHSFTEMESENEPEDVYGRGTGGEVMTATDLYNVRMLSDEDMAKRMLTSEQKSFLIAVLLVAVAIMVILLLNQKPR